MGFNSVYLRVKRYSYILGHRSKFWDTVLTSVAKIKIPYPTTFRIDHLTKEILFSNGLSHNSIKIDELDQITLESVDNDNFALFEIHYSERPKDEDKVLNKPEINGYHRFHTAVTKSFSYGGKKSLYNYYKRERDLDYYAIVTREDSKDKKIVLGSLLNPDSKINQFVSIIGYNIRSEEQFDRTTLDSHLPSNLGNRRIMKCVLDILTFEGFLNREEIKARGGLSEKFKKTRKLDQFIADPKSFHKINGIQY